MLLSTAYCSPRLASAPALAARFLSAARGPGSGPLAGMLVVSIEQAVAAPLCTLRLADAGARVVKLERSGGEFARFYDTFVHGQESSYFTWLNRGKESVEVDLKGSAEDAALVHVLLAKADVFVQNLAPGAAARAGFGSEALRERHGRLVTLDVTGYGEAGPNKDYKAYDLLVQAESGLASVTGSPDSAGRVGVSVCDIVAGMNGYAAVCEALLERERTGRGQGLAVSLFHSAAELMQVPLLQQQGTGVGPERVGLAHPSIAPYGAFDSSDGKPVLISIQNEREWVKLCSEVLHMPDVATDARFCNPSQRLANRPELDALIATVFGQATRDELVGRLYSASIAFGALNSVQDLENHPQLRRVE